MSESCAHLDSITEVTPSARGWPWNEFSRTARERVEITDRTAMLMSQ